MKQQSIILEMVDAVRIGKRAFNAAKGRASNLVMRKKRGLYAEGSSNLYRSLIDYYGAIEGKQKWASVIRNMRMEELALVKAVEDAKYKLRLAKATLKLARKHL